MVQNPPEGMPRISPCVIYDDAPAAIEFLGKAFGFEEHFRFPRPDGGVAHAELGLEGRVVMLASTYADMGYASPKNLSAHHGLVCCYVDDVDAHFARAKEHGAKILAEPEDKFYGDRSYQAEDCEGHHWTFATHVKDVAPEDMQPPA